MKKYFVLLCVGVLGWAASPAAQACAVCFNRSDSPMAYGMNAGMMVLLGVIGTMLGLVASFFVFIARRASRLAEADSPDSTV